MEFIRLERHTGHGRTGVTYVLRDEIRGITEYFYTESLDDGTQEERSYTEVKMVDGSTFRVAMTADQVHELVKTKPWETSRVASDRSKTQKIIWDNKNRVWRDVETGVKVDVP